MTPDKSNQSQQENAKGKSMVQESKARSIAVGSVERRTNHNASQDSPADKSVEKLINDLERGIELTEIQKRGLSDRINSLIRHAREETAREIDKQFELLKIKIKELESYEFEEYILEEIFKVQKYLKTKEELK